MQIEQLSIDELIPYARNSRTHSSEQVEQISVSILEFGFTNPVLVDADGGIIAGHGRVLAARKLGLDDVPCIRLGHLSETQKRAYIIADNKLALNAGWDNEMLALEFAELDGLGFDLGLTGFTTEEIADLSSPDSDSLEYTKKIKTPVYEPNGEKPPLDSLVNLAHSKKLMLEISEAAISDDEKDFLIKAAARHFVFDYQSIAEYYCHASKEMQELMENSALVIIDFNKAIEYGYVEMSKTLTEIFASSDDALDFDED